MDLTEFSMKIVIIGNSGVGKTCLVERFIRNTWSDNKGKATIGVEFVTKIVRHNSHNIQVQLWDTAGQELFRSVTRGYYRGSNGAVLVFDLTSLNSFEALDKWLCEFQEVIQSNVLSVLVGNKSDMTDQRSIPEETIQKFAREHKMVYFEASAMTGENVNQAFDHIIAEIAKQFDEGIFRPRTEDILRLRHARKQSTCCEY